MKLPNNQATNYIGVDIAKRELVCCYITNDQAQAHHTASFSNNKSGHRKFISWLQKLASLIDHDHSVHVVMEATSSYWETFATFLHEKKIVLSVVQPLRIAHFAKVLFKRSKSDPADAQTIAIYGIKMNPEPWTPLSNIHKKAKSLSRRIKQLQKQLNAENNHLEHTQDPCCKKDIKAHVRQLSTRIQKLKETLQKLIPQDSELNEQYELIKTITGIGAQSGSQIIAELPNLTEFEDARQLAAWAGLTPKHHQSGNSGKTKTPISKIGSNNLREALFFPALVAIRHNSLLRTFRDRLIENGKTKLQAVCAVMRKLLHIIYGILKHRRPFDSNYLNQDPSSTA